MSSALPATGIDGFTDEGFGPVADAFRANFADGLEVGAACAMYVDGRRVVDLWAGLADERTGRPWAKDTMTVIFSITKGLVAILAHRAVEDGHLDLDAPVATYWPEFAQAGKDEIPVRWLLSHRAGLMAVDRDLSLAEALAWTPVVKALEAQPPLWPPGSAWEYHALTYGWLVGEVLRRVAGQTPGALLRDQIAGPLRLDLWLGLPEAQEPRVATKVPSVAQTEASESGGVVDRAATMGAAFVGEHSIGNGFNDPRIHAAEVPGAGGIGTARSLAKAFAATVQDVGGVRLLHPSTLGHLTRTESESPSWLGSETGPERFSSGFMLDSERFPMLGPTSFGHDGAGGQRAFADIDHRAGFGYVSNQMGGSGEDPRAARLVTALRSCLGGG